MSSSPKYCCPTKRAPDVWDSAVFSSIFLASGFSCSQTESTPAHTQVTQAVGELSILFFSHRVQFLEFIPGIRDGETPIDGCPGGVPFSFPSTNFACYDCLATQPAIQALFSQNRDFDFGHVQPTAMFRRIVKLQFLGEVPGLLRRKSLEKAAGEWVLRLSNTTRIFSASGK
jgi:hypothetical protein